jgi:hypothetical protein
MRLNPVIAAIALLIVSTPSALALESTMTVSSPLSPNELWKKVGDFCGMTAWHPLVETCFLSEDRKQRTVLSFGGIGKAVATLDNWDNANRSYTFTNVWTFREPLNKAARFGWSLRQSGVAHPSAGLHRGGKPLFSYFRGFSSPFPVAMTAQAAVTPLRARGAFSWR